MEWHPIETAPKDGREVLAASKSSWVKCFNFFPYPIRSRFLDGKWFAHFGDNEWAPYDPQPTHWMPLLSPPK